MGEGVGRAMGGGGGGRGVEMSWAWEAILPSPVSSGVVHCRHF